MKRSGSTALRWVVGTAALAAPALHTVTDVLEWQHGGFTSAQLWLNYVAFLPMPWLLLGIHVVDEGEPGVPGLAGALAYGAAFTYFAHTTLFALAERTPAYDALWQRLGGAYTAHGALMVAGGLLFAASAWRAGWLPRHAVGLFAAGLLVNLAFALAPVPDILQTVGTAIRNLGLMAMGWAILPRARGAAATLR